MNNTAGVNEYLRPLPVAEAEDQQFWASLRRHAMEVQRCSQCDRFFFLPKPFCSFCLSDEWEWTPVSGRGVVYASTTQHHPAFSGYEAADLPYNVSLVELDEGVRICTNVIDCPPGDVRIGLRVEAVYDDVTDDVSLVRFRPLDSSPADEVTSGG